MQFVEFAIIFPHMEDYLILVGKRIREIRDDLRYKQPQFAEILGVSVQSLSKYETGGNKKGVPIKHLIKIAKIGERSLDWLITGKEDQPRTRYDFENPEDEAAAILKLQSIASSGLIEPATPCMLDWTEAQLINYYRTSNKRGQTAIMLAAQKNSVAHPAEN